MKLVRFVANNKATLSKTISVKESLLQKMIVKKINAVEKKMEMKSKKYGSTLMKKLVIALKQKVRSNLTHSAMQ